MDGLERDMIQKHLSFDLYVIITLWLVCIFSTIAVRYFYGMYLLETVQKDWFQFLRRSMQMMLRLPIDYHISTQHGEKQKIIDRASETVWDMGDSGLLHIVPQFFVMIILIVSGFFIDTRMTLISLVLLPVSIYGIHKLGNTAYVNQKKANTLWDIFFSRITDAFTNLRVLRIFSREEQELHLLTQKFTHARDAQYHIRKFWVVYNGLGNLIPSLSQAITLSAGIFFVLQNSLSLG
jgi:ABC-type multidrug transport system fused ATPase/permease subunit